MKHIAKIINGKIVYTYPSKMEKQLEVCVELGVDYIITSLGNPKSTIDACKPKGIKVFCDCGKGRLLDFI